MTARITWTQGVGARTETRTGLYWSPGPTTGSAWVIPDEHHEGEGHAVCIELKPNGSARMRKVDVERSTAAWQASKITDLRDRTRTERPYGWSTQTRTYPVAATIHPYGLEPAPRCVREQLVLVGES